MAVFINAVCEERGCMHLQPITFELLTETWQDVLDALVEAGWTIEREGAIVRFMRCPNHPPLPTAPNDPKLDEP